MRARNRLVAGGVIAGVGLIVVGMSEYALERSPSETFPYGAVAGGSVGPTTISVGVTISVAGIAGMAKARGGQEAR